LKTVNFIFGLHNHQPVGNFDFVVEHAYRHSYLPFVEVAEDFPSIALTFHFSGCLLEWLESHHPEYLEFLARFADWGFLSFLLFVAIGAVLTGKFSKERVQNLPKDDHRRKNIQFQEPKLSANLELVKSLRSVAERNNITLAQLALAWVLRRKEVTAAIVGARSQSQIQETAAAGDVKLAKDDIEIIEKLLNV